MAGQLFCSGAGDEVVHSFEFREGSLTNHHQIELRNPKLRAVPAGLAVDAAGTRLFVANVWANHVTRVDLSPQVTVADIPPGNKYGPRVPWGRLARRQTLRTKRPPSGRRRRAASSGREKLFPTPAGWMNGGSGSTSASGRRRRWR